MAKKALVILANGFEEIEAITTIDILRRCGVNVVAAGLSSLLIKGSRGLIVKADKKLTAADTNFDALVLPGGGLGAKNLSLSNTVTSIIKVMHKNNKLIAAICASPAIVLSPLGILKNKSATCYPGDEIYFDKNINFKKDAIVTDGNIITSRGPATALAFSLKIAEKLCGKTISNKIKRDVLAG